VDEAFNRRVARIAADRHSGASTILGEIVGLLADALKEGEPVTPVARALVAAQPSMAPVWNAVRAALQASDTAAFHRYMQQTTRARAAVVRHATGLFLLDASDQPLRLVTLSSSGTVSAILHALARLRPLTVSCSDGQPALEGRQLSAQLAQAGIDVTHYTDAALGQALTTASAVLVGADAISPDWFLNKSGTRALAAVAGHQGVPVYVCATRDKLISNAVATRLAIRDESPDEVWGDAPPGVTVRNRYFEPTPLDLVSAVISDSGVLGAALICDACPTAGDELLLAL
jgi:translation initiation factor 2B subunit (eIF-2B alpha/beta/delta family)